MLNQVYVGAVGVEIIVDTNQSLAGASKLEIHIKKPDGVLMTKTAATTETTKLLYTTIAGDLSLAGPYMVQAYVELAAWKGYGTPISFNVDPVLS